MTDYSNNIGIIGGGIAGLTLGCALLKKDIPGWMIPLLYAQAKLIRATHRFKIDTYDDALAYIVQAHDMHKEKSEEVDTNELLHLETEPRIGKQIDIK